jgi:sulfate adenylyltransferase subunit 1
MEVLKIATAGSVDGKILSEGYCTYKSLTTDKLEAIEKSSKQKDMIT